jgi:hypothetical protein
MTGKTLITDVGIHEYFYNEVHHAIEHQHVDASDDAAHYVVNLLTLFTKSEQLFDQTPDGPDLTPLALLYGQAIEAQTLAEQRGLLRKLADVALFIAGIFTDSLSRKAVDVDYYIAMGGSAYSYLSDRPDHPMHTIFAELAAKFHRFVDVLNEVSERAHLNSEHDMLRLYELWLKTGSGRASSRLLENGLQPIWVPSGRGRH